MAKTEISMRGALAGGLTGLAADLAFAELTGHHITTGLLELIGVGVGMFRIDRRIFAAIQDTLDQRQNSGTMKITVRWPNALTR